MGLTKASLAAGPDQTTPHGATGAASAAVTGSPTRSSEALEASGDPVRGVGIRQLGGKGIGSMSKARRLLGWEAQIDVREGLEKRGWLSQQVPPESAAAAGARKLTGNGSHEAIFGIS